MSSLALELIEKGKRTVECKNSYDDVNVEGLLDGVFTIEVKENMNGRFNDILEKEVVAKEHKIKTKETIELFLASSLELKIDRDQIEIFIRRQISRNEMRNG